MTTERSCSQMHKACGSYFALSPCLDTSHSSRGSADRVLFFCRHLAFLRRYIQNPDRPTQSNIVLWCSSYMFVDLSPHRTSVILCSSRTKTLPALTQRYLLSYFAVVYFVHGADAIHLTRSSAITGPHATHYQ